MILKLVKYGFIGTCALGLSAFYVLFFGQRIDTSFLPKDFSYCGKTISVKDFEYQQISKWLQENQKGWGLSFKEFDTSNRFHTGAFWVDISAERVVVSYKTDYGFPQFVKYVEHSLPLSCDG